jgi:transposase InsO family protein
VKVWRQLRHEGTDVVHCAVERVMRKAGLRGIMRGRVVRTTAADMKVPCPLGRVNRQFKAQRPNQLWLSDLTYVSTWLGFVYVAFIIDFFARRIVGWRVNSPMRTDFVLDTLKLMIVAAAAVVAVRTVRPRIFTISASSACCATWPTVRTCCI